jgi:hypothetical protein
MPASPPKPRWRDLALYLGAGVGLWLLASLGAGLLLALAPTPPPWVASQPALGPTAAAFAAWVSAHMETLAILVVLATNLGFQVGTVYFLGVRRGRVSWQGLGLWPARLGWLWAFVAVALTAALLPVRAVVGLLTQLLLEGGLDSLQARSQLLAGSGFTWSGFILGVFGVGVLVPFAEELFFRGLLYDWFRGRWGALAAILITSTLFGLGHFDSIGVAISGFLLGLANAILREKSGSLWPAILMHVLTNSFAMLALNALLLLGPLLPAG